MLVLTERNPRLTSVNLDWATATELEIGDAEELLEALNEIHTTEIKAMTPRSQR